MSVSDKAPNHESKIKASLDQPATSNLARVSRRVIRLSMKHNRTTFIHADSNPHIGEDSDPSKANDSQSGSVEDEQVRKNDEATVQRKAGD